ncbi:MAG: hypothetical protein ABR556_08040 [Pyrinomonadaceae bacterium]
MKFLILLLGVCLVPHATAKPGVHKSSVSSGSISAIRHHVSFSRTSVPATEKLELITHLPRELPQRISDIVYDGEKLWAIIYHGQGRYATFDPVTYGWTASYSNQQHQAIRKVAGLFESPGGLCFANGKLWVSGSYGESFGSIDLATWRVERIFKGKQQNHRASQSYSGMTFDGTHLWMAWHWFNYRLRSSQTQLLLKIDPQTGEVIQQFSLPPGTAPDGTHGLTWDGKQLWHVKDQLLAAIDPSNGQVTARYNLKSLRRPSGLAWDGTALWIAEFEGRIFRLPFQEGTLARL